MEMQLSVHMCAWSRVCVWVCFEMHTIQSKISTLFSRFPAPQFLLSHCCNRRSLKWTWTSLTSIPQPHPGRHASSSIPVLGPGRRDPPMSSILYPEKTETFLRPTQTHTQLPTPPHPRPHTPARHPCLVPASYSGCRAREQEAPRLSQLFQTPSLPWAPHSLIQGSFVVLTSWNSWAAQLLMLL